jgi:hypothetical protein
MEDKFISTCRSLVLDLAIGLIGVVGVAVVGGLEMMSVGRIVSFSSLGKIRP